MNTLGAVIFLLVICCVLGFLNGYTYQGIKTMVEGWESERVRLWVKVGYWIIMGGIMIWIIATFIRIMREGQISTGSQQMLNVMLTLMVTQLTIILFLFGEDLYRTLAYVVNFLKNTSEEPQGYMPERRKFVSQMAFAVASIPFAGFVYGVWKGKYHFRVIRQTIYFEDLPEAFDGFTITQISDIHAGSFTDLEAVQKGIDLAKQQDSDLFVFTGDLVNHKAEEINPFLEGFAEIRSAYGQYSILGNHDYGDYISWPSQEAKKENFERLKAKHQKMGFKLLLDEQVTIKKDGQRIRLIGVENWGVGFQSRGDLEKALSDVPQDEFKILLSHDPSHWDREVIHHSKKVQLTLSGHTHGMQFGIETPLIRWSPAQFRYPNWAGLAEDAGKFLYVNRGFGFHAFSGRVGIWPEITVLELRKG